MTETDAERFLEEAQECLRQAAMAVSRLDAESWLRMAKEWTRLAKEVEQ
jgi:hypothetical protein